MQLFCNDESFISQIPHSSGVYRFYNNEDSLLYVGKAINLSKRVSSYFRKQANLSPRISIMVAQIHHIELTLTENEVSALLLENNLIKSLKPKFNVIFRDDKTYPMVKLTQHEFPRIEYYRGKTNKDDNFFGPYPNSTALKEAMDMIQKLFKLRTCNNSFFSNRSRPCMLYQINLCSAPCVNYVTSDEYSAQVKLATDFLNGKYAAIINQLTTDMYHFADNLNFEQSANLRDKIAVLKQMKTKQIISDHNRLVNADVLAYKVDDTYLYLYLIMLRNGVYVGDNTFRIKHLDDITEALEAFLDGYYINNKGVKLVYLAYEFDDDFKQLLHNACKINIINKIPNNLLELYQMAQFNLQHYQENSGETVEINAELAKLFELTEVNRVECYDISHHHGDSGVAAMVVCQDGIMNHKLYRRYNLSKDINGDDILALTTILRRRLSSSIAFPEIILLDGGRNQLNAIKKLVVELGLCGKIRLLAIFKGDGRRPELDSVIIDNDKQIMFSEYPKIFRLLQQLRDEAHRFAITGHRKKQIKLINNSELNSIPLIGAKKRQALIAYFGSVKNVAVATVEELQLVSGIGNTLALQIYDYFH